MKTAKFIFNLLNSFYTICGIIPPSPLVFVNRKPYLRTVMKEFLKTVAEHYYAVATAAPGGKSSDPLGFTRYLFVFPNRRSGLFFRHYLSEQSHSPLMAPATTTLSELFASLSVPLRVTDRMTQLFRLYGLYRELSGTSEEFDNFVFWGDMLLSDFDEIDKYMVNARELFHNIRDIKEIDLAYSDYSPEVLAVIRSFWAHLLSYNQQDRKKDAFTRTWNILYDLYDRFRTSLEADGLAYEGMLMRRVVEDMQNGSLDDRQLTRLLPHRQIVFVGLTAINRVTRALMTRLKIRGLCEFCWDYADRRLTDPAVNAGYFTAANLADFPNVLDENELREGVVADEDKEIDVYAVSSGVGQATQAQRILRQWVSEGSVQPASADLRNPCNAIRTAVVLPDEKLLMPMLYAVPLEFEPFNVTMGYSLKSTPVSGFVDAIMRLQLESRPGRDGKGDFFYYHSAQALLAHNYLARLCGPVAFGKSEEITRLGLLHVPAGFFTGHPVLELLFRRTTGVADSIAYLQAVFGLLLQHAEKESGEAAENLFAEQELFGSMEREFLFAYSQAVDSLADLVQTYSYTFRQNTLFHLLQRLTQGVKVPFTGEPLAGLQIMGVLETRALDFDNIIILSMNEGIFPSRSSDNTFIPVNLRTAFGLPTPKHQDAVYAYHFYRLISRARRISFIYDTRSDGMQTGEMSRYLLQMQYLYRFPRMRFLPVRQNIGIIEVQPFMVKKDARIMRLLDRFRQGGDRALSASALKDYICCPLKFYLSYLAELKEDNEIAEGIDNSQLGSVFHEAMKSLYNPLRGRVVTADYLRALIKHPAAVREAVELAFHKVMKGVALEGYFILIAEIIQEYVRNVVAHDMTLCPFTHLASEFCQESDYPVQTGLTVRLKCFYDRLDIGRDRRLRIIDYKTGRSKTATQQSKCNINSIAGLFDPKNSGATDEAFQVMMYCLMFGLLSPEERTRLKLDGDGGYEGISPHLYFIRDFHQEQIETILTYRPGRMQPEEECGLPAGAMEDYASFASVFESMFRRFVAELFDAEQPFRQCEGIESCRYCPYRALCKR